MVIKAKSPSVFAEKYIVESIWNGRFPPGSILPAERELSELIGVTRTTLREVLQRLARDGWLTIRHGKPTRVNQFMETSSLNILDTLITLDVANVNSIVEDLISVRTSISSIFIVYAFKRSKSIARKIISDVINSCELLFEVTDWDEFLKSSSYINEYYQKHPLNTEKDEKKRQLLLLAKTFNFYDYLLFQRLAFHSGNQIYAFIFNGFKKIYDRVGSYYFSNPEARKLALNFYNQLLAGTENLNLDKIPFIIHRYGTENLNLWDNMRTRLPNDFTEDIN
ncbi:fatty acid metabolism regulator protein [Candidatus Photodesmus katoptron]|uniref:Fatty acid metabolism regulator protein n=1 Tax=Candidatus Photodesmus katoptron Akat1 TaxID=1236703 RepID=S3DHF7_9GAMM|nr:fatty acid metabolism transcriptional regulator FadR [Candidatus Photodesmus katoptron]EPE37857.1 fatty acid metabolism transcriptional regulator FadR [Candidatus Photodesmus katoptron Akat1]KEY90424.1 fatty acid metabolism regulator protein [Candidatus Photodesmus katoptron]